MSTPTRLRAITKDGITDVRVLITHPMDSGLRKDAAGNLVPIHYITDFHATVNERKALSAKWSFAVSQDPFVWFRLRDVKPGDVIAVTWLDNTGDTRTDQVTVS